MRLYKLLIFLGLSFLSSFMLKAQVQPTKKISILKGQVYTDTVYSRYQPIPLPGSVSNTDLTLEYLGNYLYKVIIESLNPNFLGNTRPILKVISAPPLKPYYIEYNIDFVSSIVHSYDDFITFTSDSTITTDPTANDMRTDSVLMLRGIAKVEGGSATYENNNISLIPTAGIDYARVIYSAVDSKGTSNAALIHYIRTGNSFESVDTFSYTLLNTRKQYVFMPAAGFSVSSAPSKGTVTALHSHVFQYIPNAFASGDDSFTLLDSLGNIRYVQIKLIAKAVNLSSVRDDAVYTTVNTPVTFNVLANDLANHFPIVYRSPEMIPAGGAGNYTYTPPQNFSGVKNFVYTVNYGNYQATGKVSVHIGNYVPQPELDYSFSTYVNQPIVLTYDMPIDGYTFEPIGSYEYGNIDTIHNNIYVDSCGSFYSKAHIIYTPLIAVSDTVQLNYCVADSCTIIKFAVNVFENDAVDACYCSGPECVWSGDLNGDGLVSVTDILSLGRFMGLAGQTRTDSIFPFRGGQYSDEWYYAQPNGKNTKHIDADGDGMISIADTVYVSQNYGTVSRLVAEEILAVKDYPFDFVITPSAPQIGDLLEIEFSAGTVDEPVKDLLGLTFSLGVNSSAVDSSSLRAEFYSENWFGKHAQTVSMVKQPKDGLFHVGYTRALGIVEDELEGIKPRGATGYGSLGKLAFIVEDELEGIRSDDEYRICRIKTDKIILEDITGERISLPSIEKEIKIKINKGTPVPTEDKLLVFPNPASETVQLYFNGRNIIEGYRLFDMQGRVVLQQEQIGTQGTNLDVSHLDQGMYHLQVYTAQGMVGKKVMVVRE